MWAAILGLLPLALAVNVSFVCDNLDTAPHWYGPTAIKGGTVFGAIGSLQCGMERKRNCNAAGWSPADGYSSTSYGQVFANNGQ